jgi:hypothetical protein
VLLSRLCEKNEESKAAGLLCKARALRYEAQKANLSPLTNTNERIKKIGEERRKHLPRINADARTRKAKSQKRRAKSQKPTANSSFHPIRCMAAPEPKI